MTTIAYKDGLMAADTAVVDGSVIIGHVPKIYPGRGGAVAASGDVSDVVKFCRWWLAGADAENPPDLNKDRTIVAISVVVDGDGNELVECWDSGLVPCAIRAPFHATGSGFEIAIGAMAAGASAEDAVRIASRYDTMTGGEIMVFDARFGPTRQVCSK